MIREARTSGPLSGRMRVPGSKSLTNRALVCASLARGRSVLTNASSSDDTGLLANGLNQFGILVQREGSTLTVEGKGGTLYAPKFPVPSGNAGTTLRFLLSLGALAAGGTTVIETSERMAARPNEELVEALRAMGVPVRHDPGSTRFEVTGGGLAGGSCAVRSDRSSQFLSSILMVAPYARTRCTLSAPGSSASGGYIRLTLDVMESFGVPVERTGSATFAVDAPAPYRAAPYEVEADASGATYPFAAAAIAGGTVFVPGVLPSSHQPDAGFTEVLQAMGCRVEAAGGGTRVSRTGTLRPVDVTMSGMPDAVPALLAAALFAEGETMVRGIGHLRFKESNRIEDFAGELRKLGADIGVEEDFMTVRPAPLHGELLLTHDDHRLAMSFATIGLRVPGVQVDDPGCVRKSYPAFWEELDGLVEESAH
ncbi:MAG TPA: 3-phosphoshikimate 1-carboxyvinyltransferase [Bacteroidota bacterium]|nr:3-phosphoshikimate 1-carboxyvinyltransferase [Bacteroidota bacterium]